MPMLRRPNGRRLEAMVSPLAAVKRWRTFEIVAAGGAGEPRMGLRLCREPSREPSGFQEDSGWAQALPAELAETRQVCGWGGRVPPRVLDGPG